MAELVNKENVLIQTPEGCMLNFYYITILTGKGKDDFRSFVLCGPCFHEHDEYFDYGFAQSPLAPNTILQCNCPMCGRQCDNMVETDSKNGIVFAGKKIQR